MKSIYLLLIAPIFFFPFLLNSQIQIGSIDGEAAGDRSGSVSLSSDGSVIAIGAYLNDGANGVDSGQVRVYEYNGVQWVLKGGDIDGEAAGDVFGWRVRLSANGDIVAIGAYLNDGANGVDSGHVRVFEYDGTNWIQMGDDIDGEAAGDWSSQSLSLSSDGNIVAIGSLINDGANGVDSGHVRVFEYNGTDWNQKGDDLDGAAADDRFSTDISLSSDGSNIAISAYRADTPFGFTSGQVKIFEFNGLAWVQKGNDINGEYPNESSGSYVSLSSNGNLVAVGNILNDEVAADSGQVRIYQYNGVTWDQLGNDINGEASGDFFGTRVVLSSNGNIVAIGSPSHDIGASSNIGYVQIYKNNNGSWEKIGSDIVGESANDSFGASVSLSSDGGLVAVGSRNHNSFKGRARVFDISALLSSDEVVLSKYILYPNPAKNKFTIELREGLELENVNIYNHFGQFICSAKTNTIKTHSLSSGIYFVEIITNQGKATKKIVVK